MTTSAVFTCSFMCTATLPLRTGALCVNVHLYLRLPLGTQQNDDCVVNSKMSMCQIQKLFLLLFHDVVSTANVIWRRKLHDTWVWNANREGPHISFTTATRVADTGELFPPVIKPTHMTFRQLQKQPTQSVLLHAFLFGYFRNGKTFLI
jgi:hypothetical protein